MFGIEKPIANGNFALLPLACPLIYPCQQRFIATHFPYCSGGLRRARLWREASDAGKVAPLVLDGDSC